MSPRLNRVWLVAPFLLLSLQVWALGLGDIRLSSALNEPLRAEIELLAATPEELNNLTVQLASQDTFQRYDLDRPNFLTTLEFEVVRSGSADGNIVRVTSTEPITEPFITFLVEASWSRGRLLREYTLLLDPPTFAPPPSTPQAEAVTAPTRSAPADSGQIDRPAPRQETPPPPAEQPVVRAPVQAPAETPAPAPAETQTSPVPSPAPEPAPEPIPDPIQEPAPEPAAAPSSQPAFLTGFPDEVQVVRGDTLWGITQRVRPDSNMTINQMMLAIYEANPEAFEGNINRLRAGVTLRVPEADDVFRINRADAYNEVLRQENEWLGGTGADAFADVEPEPVFEPEPAPAPEPEPVVDSSPSLTLVPPDEEDLSLSDTSVDTAAADDTVDDAFDDAADDVATDPEERIRQIEATLQDQDALIEIPDNELAALRQELADLREQTAALEEPVIEEAPDDAAEDVLADDSAEDTAAPTVTAPVVSRPSQDEGIVGTILGYLNNFWVWIGAALVVTVAILAWFMRRAANRDDEDVTGVWETLDTGDVDADELASTERLRAMARDDESIVVTETIAEPEMSALVDTMEAPAATEPEEPASLSATDSHAALEMPDVFDAPDTADAPESFEMPAAEPDEAPMAEAPEAEMDVAAATGTHQAMEDTFSSETAINLDQTDPIAEADFHMAYGLYDQAADLINGALGTEPNREDLLAKLCEIYFVWGNRDAFVDAAERLKGQVGGEANAEWDKIVIMGQQIAADHELFSGVSAEGVTKAVDLSFEGGMDEAGGLDMDFAGVEEDAGSDVIDLGAEEAADDEDEDDVIDIGAFAKDDVVATDETGQVLIPPDSGSGIDFSLDDEAPGIEVSATHEMPTSDDDGGTAEMPAVDSPTIEQQFDMGATGELPAVSEPEPEEPEIPPADATAEIDLDDLGLDLDSLEDTAMAEDVEDEETLGDLDDTASGEALEAGDLDATGTEGALESTSTHEALDLDEIAADATGVNEALDAALESTSTHEALDLDAVAAADDTGELPAIDDDVGGTTEVLEDDQATMLASLDDDDEETDVGIDTTLLDATGQTQILTEDMAVETAADVDVMVSDSDATMLAPGLGEEQTVSESLADEAETLLAPVDDEEDEGDFDFAKTEALPKDVFSPDMSTDDTGRMPGLTGSTDMDLDLDDLTAALKVSEVGDTVNQIRDDATVEQPRLRPDANGSGDDTAATGITQSLSPDDLSDELSEARTMTEVGTKLDLARAYVDMGDPGGAKSILEEVLDEGDEGQKQQAQQLIDSLPT
jgi:pilus assembly protein FimV